MNYYDILFARKMAGGQGKIITEGLSVTENGTYTAPEGKAYTPVVVNVSGYKIKDIPNTPTAIATFNASALPMPSLKVGIEPIQEGSGDPSPSNVRPISGWSAVNVTRCGKNLWGGEKLADDIVAKVPNATKDTTNKTVTYSAGSVAEKVLFDNFKPNTRYTIVMMTSSSANNVTVRYTDGTNSYINKSTFTVTQADKSVECIIGIWSTGTTVLKYEDCGVFEGVLTADDFEPYNGHTYTIDLDRTRYGGKLDVVSGVLTVTHGYIASYNGETLPSTWISDRDVYVEGTSPTTGAQVVYELATPITIQLNPTMVKSLLGTNNIWVDTGDVLEGSYFKEL